MTQVNCPTFYFKIKEELLKSDNYINVPLYVYIPEQSKAINTVNNTDSIKASPNEALSYIQDEWVACGTNGIIIDGERREELDNLYYSNQNKVKKDNTTKSDIKQPNTRLHTEKLIYLNLTDEDIKNKRILLTDEIISEIISATNN